MAAESRSRSPVPKDNEASLAGSPLAMSSNMPARAMAMPARRSRVMASPKKMRARMMVNRGDEVAIRDMFSAGTLCAPI